MKKRIICDRSRSTLRFFPALKLRQMFTQIVLHYDRGQSVVTKVEMLEKNGDCTAIELSSINLNAKIEESVYALNEK